SGGSGLAGVRGLGGGGIGSSGGLVSGLLSLLRAGTQGQAQGQGEQGLVQGHGSFPRLEYEFWNRLRAPAGAHAVKIMSRSRSQSSARLKLASGQLDGDRRGLAAKIGRASCRERGESPRE